LRGALSEAHTQTRQLSYSVKHSEQQEDLLKTQGSELRDLVGELEARGEAVTRELNARRDEIQAVTQIRDAEIRQIRVAQDKAVRELSEELATLETQKTALETQHQVLLSKVTELETEKRKEMSQVQQDIRKLEQDIEGLQSKLRTKENNPHFQQVNEFFTQVKEVYMAEYRTLIGQRVQDQLKERKKAMFDSQRQLTEVEYRVQQRELEVKKGLDEELRRHKDGLDSQEEELKVTKIENERLRLQAMIDRRTQQESQLTGVIGQIQEAKERLMAVMEQRDNQRRAGVSLKEAKLRSLHKDLEEVKQGQIRMEDKIYMLSLENKQRQDDKEIMLMLLPHILKTIKGQPNNLKGIMQQMDSEGLKNKVMKLLQAYKIPGIK
jgi:DNA repair exonuclease SbcCD ATPase subunit